MSRLLRSGSVGGTPKLVAAKRRRLADEAADEQYVILVVGDYRTGKGSLIRSLLAQLQTGAAKASCSSDRGDETDEELAIEWRLRVCVENTERHVELVLRKCSQLVELVRPSSNRTVDPSPLLLAQVRQAHGVLGVYNATALQTFKTLLLLHGFLLRARGGGGEQRLPFLLCGTFCDLVARSIRPREVTFESVKELALQYGVPFFDTMAEGPQGDGKQSEISSSQIVNAFSELVNEIVQLGVNARHEAAMLERLRDRSFRESRVDCAELKFSSRFKDRNGNPEIRCGTLERLVERLSYHKYPSTDFMNTFLLTFRMFTTKYELLRLLAERYNMKEPASVSAGGAEAQKEWRAAFLTPVRMRVTNVLLHWIEDHTYDFDNDPQMVAQLQAFFNLIQSTSPAQYARLQKTYDKASAGRLTVGNLVLPTKPPKPLVTKRVLSGKPFGVRDIKPLELARQWALVDHRQLCLIKPYEWCMSFWSGNQIGVNFVRQTITKFNIRVSWVCHEILQPVDPKERAKVLKHFIQVGRHAVELNCFSALMAISAALESIPIHRLAKTWELLPRKWQDEYAMISKEICSPAGNYQVLRERIESLRPPLVPYLGIYLSDLTFIQDGNPKLIDGLINFEKCRMLARTVEKLRTFQKSFYCLQEVRPIMQWLENVKPLADADTELYQLSLRREPRITEANVISRPTQVRLPAQQQDAHQEMAARLRAMFETAAAARGADLVATLKSWAVRLTDPTPLIGGKNFLDCLLESRAVERLLLSLVTEEPAVRAQLDAVVPTKIFCYILTGTRRMHTELWLSVSSLSQALPSKITAILSGALAVYKVQPVDEHEAQFWALQHRTIELRKLVTVLDGQNRAESVTNNGRKLRAYAAIIVLQKCSRDCLKKLSTAIMDSNGLFFQRKTADSRILSMVEQTTEALVATNQLSQEIAQPVIEFIAMVKLHMQHIVQHIEDLPRVWPQLCQESFDALRAHLLLLRDQVGLLHQRLMHLQRLVSSESDADRFGLADVATDLRSKMKDALASDLYDLRRWVAELDYIEPIVDTLDAESASRADLIKIAVDIRAVYCNLEDEFPQLRDMQLKPDDQRSLTKNWHTEAIPADLLRTGRRSTLRASLSPEQLSLLMEEKKLRLGEYHACSRRSLAVVGSPATGVMRKAGSMLARMNGLGVVAAPPALVSPTAAAAAAASTDQSIRFGRGLTTSVSMPAINVAKFGHDDDSVAAASSTNDNRSSDDDDLVVDYEEASGSEQQANELPSVDSPQSSRSDSFSSSEPPSLSGSSESPPPSFTASDDLLIAGMDELGGLPSETGFCEENAPVEVPKLPDDVASWTAEQVCLWLNSLGQARCVVDAFRNNKLLGEDLLELSRDNLMIDVGIDDATVVDALLISIDALKPRPSTPVVDDARQSEADADADADVEDEPDIVVGTPRYHSDDDKDDEEKDSVEPAAPVVASVSEPQQAEAVSAPAAVVSRYTSFERTAAPSRLRPKSGTVVRGRLGASAQADRRATTASVQAPSGHPDSWSVNDVHTWILSAGFSPLIAAAVRQNELKGCDLPSLTDFELEVDLGVSSIETRCRLLRAIRTLMAQQQQQQQSAQPGGAKPELEAFLDSAAAKAKSEAQAAEAAERAEEEKRKAAVAVEESSRVMKIHLEKEDALLESIGVRSHFKAILLQRNDTLLDVVTLLINRLTLGMKEQQLALAQSTLHAFQLFYIDNGASVFFPDSGPLWPVVKQNELTTLHFRQAARCAAAVALPPASKLIVRVHLEDSQPAIRNLQLGNTVKAIVLSQGMRVENLLAMTANRVTRGMDQVRTDFINRTLADHKLYYVATGGGEPAMELLTDTDDDLLGRFTGGALPQQLYLRSPSCPAPPPSAAAPKPALALNKAPSREALPSTPKKIIKILLESTDATLRNLGIDNTAKAVFVEQQSTVDDLQQQLISRITRGMTAAQAQMITQATANHRLFYLKDDVACSLADATKDVSVWDAFERELVPAQLVFRIGEEHVRAILANRSRPASMMHSSSPVGAPLTRQSSVTLTTPTRPPPPTASLPPPTATLPPPTAVLPPPTATLPPATAVLPPPTAMLPPASPASSSSSPVPPSAPRRVQSMYSMSAPAPGSPSRADSRDGLSPTTGKVIVKAILLPSADEELIALGMSNTRKALVVEPQTSAVALYGQLIKNLTKGLSASQAASVISKFERHRFFQLSGSYYEQLTEGTSSLYQQLTSGGLPHELYVIEAPSRFYLEPSAKPVSVWLSRDIADWFIAQHLPPDVAEQFVEQGLYGIDLDGLTAVEFEEDFKVKDPKIVRLLLDGVAFLMNPRPPQKLLAEAAAPVAPSPSPVVQESSPTRSPARSAAKSSKRLSFFGGSKN